MAKLTHLRNSNSEKGLPGIFVRTHVNFLSWKAAAGLLPPFQEICRDGILFIFAQNCRAKSATGRAVETQIAYKIALKALHSSAMSNATTA